MKRIITLLILLAPFIGVSQNLVTQGTINNGPRHRGGFAVDSMIQIPYKDTTSWFGLQGNLTIRPQDGKLYFRSNGSWKLSEGNQQVESFTGTLAQVRALNIEPNNIILTDYGCGVFYKNDTVTVDNTGTQIKNALGQGYSRILDGSVIHPEWWGAKGDWNGTTGTDNAPFIQAALDFAVSNPLKLFKVELGAGQFMVSKTVYASYGTYFYGNNGKIESFNRSGTRLVLKPGTNKDLIRVIPNVDASSGGMFWQGSIYDMVLVGSGSSTDSSWAINFSDSLGNGVSAQDVTKIENLVIRNFRSGGINAPLAGLPLNIKDIKFLFNGGPGIYYSNGTNQYRNQSSHFENISGDGNIGGLIVLNNLSKHGALTITNVKSERRLNPTFGNVGAQENVVVIDNCDSTTISIRGGTHISSYRPSPTSAITKPGDFIKVTGTGRPYLTWDNLLIRVRATDSVSKDPGILAAPTDTVDMTVHSGTYVYGGAGFRSQSIGYFGEGNNAAAVIGKRSQYQNRSSLSESGLQVATNLPALSFYETDQLDTSLNKHWAFTLNSGSFILRKIMPNGTFVNPFAFNADGVTGNIVRLNTIASEVRVENAVPRLSWYKPSGIANSRYWFMGMSNASNNLNISLANDVGTLTDAMRIERDTDTLGGISFFTRLMLSKVDTIAGTTPSGRFASNFITNNLTPVNMTFLTETKVGQISIIRINDGNTTFVHDAAGEGGMLFLRDRENWKANAGDVIVFVRGSKYQHEIARVTLKAGLVNDLAAKPDKLTANATIDFPLIAPHTEGAGMTVSVAGALTTDNVIVNAPNVAGIVYKATVTAPNTITVHPVNTTTADIDPPSGNFRVLVLR